MFRHLNRVLRSDYVTEVNKRLALYLYDYSHVTYNEGKGSALFEIMLCIRYTTLYLYDYSHVTYNEGKCSALYEIMLCIRHTNTPARQAVVSHSAVFNKNHKTVSSSSSSSSIIIIIIIIIIILVITFVQGIYYYIPATNHVSKVYSIEAVLYLPFVLHGMLFRP